MRQTAQVSPCLIQSWPFQDKFVYVPVRFPEKNYCCSIHCYWHSNCIRSPLPEMILPFGAHWHHTPSIASRGPTRYWCLVPPQPIHLHRCQSHLSISALIRSWNRLVLPTANYPRMFQEGSMCSEYDPYLNFVFQSFSFFGISELWKGCPLVVGYRACVLAIYYLRRLALLFISQIINKQEMKQIDVTFWQVLKIGSKNKGSYNFH